jgi:N-methylhydantoinase B
VFTVIQGGGGGYGDPLERDPESVRSDVVAGYVSAEQAEIEYGVRLDAAGHVDIAATKTLRNRFS